jgi:integrase/recombinase XerD
MESQTRIQQLHGSFLKERIYLKNVTEKTVAFHQCGFNILSPHLPEIQSPDQFNKSVQLDLIIKLKESGVKTVSINTYCRSINAFLAWLFENGHIGSKLRIAKLKEEKAPVSVVPVKYFDKLLKYKPTALWERRIHTLLMVLFDCGVCIDEALGLKVSDVDLDNMMLTVHGKGRKTRIIPYSDGLRKYLYRLINSKEYSKLPKDRYVFANRHGGRFLYDNARRDYQKLCEKLEIDRIGAFHCIRHTFATWYLQHGGNVIYLSRTLGHSQISTTQIYVHSNAEALKETHCSMLNR